MAKWDSFLNDRFIDLFLGIIFFAAAVISTRAGKTFSGFGGWRTATKIGRSFGGQSRCCMQVPPFVLAFTWACYLRQFFTPNDGCIKVLPNSGWITGNPDVSLCRDGSVCTFEAGFVPDSWNILQNIKLVPSVIEGDLFHCRDSSCVAHLLGAELVVIFPIAYELLQRRL